MNELVVTIMAGEIVEGDEILVPLTFPPTRVKVWKISEASAIERVGIHCMEGENTWRTVLHKSDFVQVIR